MKKSALFFVSFSVLLSVQAGFAADKPAPLFQNTVKQRELPPELLEWMSERYDAKTLRGLKWKNLDKARLSLTLNRMEAYTAKPGSLFSAGKSGGVRNTGPAARRSAMRLDISPAAMQKSFYTDVTSDTYDIKLTGLGGAVGWNAGYSKVSETEDYSAWSGGTSSTKADVLFASMVFSAPTAGGFAPYLFAGPARVKYTYSETTTDITFDPLGPPWWITTTSSLSKSDTVLTWIMGVGAAYTLPGSNLGFFMEYKHIPEAGYFNGLDNLGLGVSLSI